MRRLFRFVEMAWHARPAPLLLFAACSAWCLASCGGLTEADQEGAGFGGLASIQPGVTAGSGGTESVSSSGGTKPDGAAGVEEPVGTFSVRLIPVNVDTGTAAHAWLLGAVRESPVAQPGSWTVLQEMSGCQVQRPTIPFCDPACDVGQACVRSDQGDVCVPNAPAPHSVGEVTVQGVKTAEGANEFTVEPSDSLNYVRVDLAYPPFLEGDTIELEATGGDYVPFHISVHAIRPLCVQQSTVSVVPGNPVSITWEASTAPDGDSIEVTLELSEHATSRARILCTAGDVGHLEIPAQLITPLIEIGIAGFPVLTITRRAVSSAELPQGRVDLLLASEVELPVEVSGVTSCKSTDDCPSGQTCSALNLCAP